MALSNFYKQNEQTLNYSNRYINTNSNIGVAVADYYKNYSGTYDNSNVFTMCVDNDLNCCRYVPEGEASYNAASITSVMVTQCKNAVFYAVHDTKFDNKKCGYYDGVYGGNSIRPTTAPKFDRQFIMPYIAVIEKDKINEDNINTSNESGAFFKTADVKQVTLAELVRNKDKYMVTDVQLRFIIVSASSDLRWDMAHYDHGFITDSGFTAISTDCITGQPILDLNAVTFKTNIVPLYVSQSYVSGTLHSNFMWYPSGVDEKRDRYINYPFPDSVEINPGDVKDGAHYFKYDCNGGLFLVKSIKNVTNSSNSLSFKMLFTADWIIKKIASFGLYVAYDTMNHYDIPFGVLTGNEHLALGEMNSSGFTTGVLLKPGEIADSNTKQKNWVTGDEQTINPGDYKPVKPDGDDITEPDYRIADQIGGFTMYYKVSQSDLLTIVQRVNFPDSEHPIPEGWEFAPHLVSCTQYPYNVAEYVGGHTSNVIIGSWDSGVSSLALTSTQFAVRTIAEFRLEHKYNSFLDYSPYAQYQIYVPLCGWVDLPDICVGKMITVELATDAINNSCVATIKADGCPICHKVGHMGSSVAISVTENGLKQAALTQSLFNAVGAVTSTGYAVATQNPIGIVNGIASVAASISQGNIANNSNYTRQIGSTSDKSDFHISNTCYLKMCYTQPDETPTYAHSIGYPCIKSGIVDEFSGYTVCSDVDVSGLSCTQNQKDIIKRMLETGFYI